MNISIFIPHGIKIGCQTTFFTFAGGGLPIGSILLIEEDKIGRYAKCLTRLFLAEGSVHKHAIFVANLDADPSDTVDN